MGKSPFAVGVGLTVLATALVGCSSTATSSESSAPASASASNSAAAASCPLTVSDPWAKAAETGMTAAFGVVKNPTGSPVTITAASSPAAGMTQLHETIDVNGTMEMKQVPQFVVPANGEFTLQPGGNHIMLMNIPAPIKAGEDVQVTLTCGTAGTTEFTAQARTFAGANETYVPGMGSPSASSSMPGM